jgi:uncharacterized protein YhaN
MELEKKYELLNKAKCHLAYTITNKISRLKNLVGKIDQDKITTLRNRISNWLSRERQLIQREKEQKELQKKSHNFEWLDSATEQYKDLLSDSPLRIQRWPVVIATAFFIATVGLVLNGRGLMALVCLVLAVFFTYLYIRYLNRAVSKATQNEELAKIAKAFCKKIGEELTDISTLVAETERQRKNRTLAEGREEDLFLERQGVEEENESILNEFQNLIDKQPQSNDWRNEIREIQRMFDENNTEITKLQKQLYELQVDESDYMPEDPGVSYSKEERTKCAEEVQKIDDQISEQELHLRTLKEKLAIEVSGSIIETWELLIEKLQEMRQERKKDYESIVARILGGVAVTAVVNEFLQQEEEKIKEGLESETVTQPLYELTSRYQNITLIDGKLEVGDEYQTFLLDDLSTGAREQVMLSLRIGFASKLLGTGSAFLILDDAFQHSDWKRRETLINGLAQIARNGWQIIYLTMDNHIKELFEKHSKIDGFQSIEL